MLLCVTVLWTQIVQKFMTACAQSFYTVLEEGRLNKKERGLYDVTSPWKQITYRQYVILEKSWGVIIDDQKLMKIWLDRK